MNYSNRGVKSETQRRKNAKQNPLIVVVHLIAESLCRKEIFHCIVSTPSALP